MRFGLLFLSAASDNDTIYIILRIFDYSHTSNVSHFSRDKHLDILTDRNRFHSSAKRARKSS